MTWFIALLVVLSLLPLASDSRVCLLQTEPDRPGPVLLLRME